MVKYLLFIILITSNLDISKLSQNDYLEVKSTLKNKVSNMTTTKLSFAERDKWLEVVIKELKSGCKLKNVNSKNLISSLNNCL